MNKAPALKIGDTVFLVFNDTPNARRTGHRKVILRHGRFVVREQGGFTPLSAFEPRYNGCFWAWHLR